LSSTSFFQEGAAKCTHYSRTRDSEEDPHPAAREFIERLWKECALYVDSNALDHAKQDMVSVFWELYLAHALKRSGIALVQQSRTKKKQRGPDLRAQNPDVWIEAIAPTAGFGENAISEPVLGTTYQVPIEEFVLRLRAAIEIKSQVFEGYISDGIVPVSHATIVAVSGAILPTKFSEQPIPRIVRALLGVDNQVVTLDRLTGKTIGTYLDYSDTIHNAKGSPIKTDVFLDPAYSHISAVIYSYADWINVFLDPGAEFMLVHNPTATNPLPLGWLNNGTEYWSDGTSISISRHRVQSSS
jgi:hypothetical protein